MGCHVCPLLREGLCYLCCLIRIHFLFDGSQAAIARETDIHSDTTVVENVPKRIVVGDTDNGKKIKETIRELEGLLKAYRSGLIVELEI